MEFPPDDKLSQTIYRSALIASVATFVASLPLYIVSEMAVGIDASDVDILSESTGLISTSEAAGVFFLLVGLPALVLSWVGLFNYWPSSRWLYLIVNIIFAVLTIAIGFSSFTYQWELPLAISGVHGFLGGCVLSMAFLSSIAKKFNRDDAN